MKKLLALILSLAMALSLMACAAAPDPTESPTDPAPAVETNAAGAVIMGEGATAFRFVVVDTEGKETVYEIHTDETVLGTALLDLGLIAGEEGDYGIYVKTVNGITLDYDKDGKFWALYVGDESSMVGADQVEIVPGDTYMFKAE